MTLPLIVVKSRRRRQRLDFMMTVTVELESQWRLVMLDRETPAD